MKHLKHILKIQLFQNILIFIMLTVITFATDTAIILGNMNYKHTQNGNVAKYLLCPDSSNN